MRGKVLTPKETACCAGERVEGFGKTALVEGLAVGGRDLAQGRAMVGERDDITRRWAFAAHAERVEPAGEFGADGVTLVLAGRNPPRIGHHRADGEAPFGKSDRRFGQRRKGQPSESFVKREPRRNGSGYGDREPPEVGDLREPAGQVLVLGCQGRRAT